MEKQSIVKGKTIKQVKKLNLSGLGLKEIPSDVFQYTNLKKLILSRNEIVRIPKEIAMLRKLEVLDLSYNKIQMLPAPVFKLPKLRVLAVGHNRLKKFPSQLVGSSVEQLIADHNQIVEIDPKAMDNLTKLVISYNPIKGILVDHYLPKLRYFDFRNTELEELGLKYLSVDCRFFFPMKQSESKEEPIESKQQASDGHIFISHSSKDTHIIRKFVEDILRLGVNLAPEHIRCSSIEGYGIKNGEDMRRWIREEITNCSMAFLMISPNYQASQICLNEMGAIWALNKQVKLFLLPGIDTDNFGWLEEVRQAGRINDSNVLDELYDTLAGIFHVEKNITTWTPKKEGFISFCHSLPQEGTVLEKNDLTDVYLGYCSKIFDILNHEMLPSALGHLVNNSSPMMTSEFMDRLDTLIQYLSSRMSHPGYKSFDALFQSMMQFVIDFQNTFSINAKSEKNLLVTRRFYKELVPNPHYDEDLADYNSYICFIRNMAHEFARLCNALLNEARKLKSDFMADFGIVSIDDFFYMGNSTIRFIYRTNECYEGLDDFITNSDKREFAESYSKDRIRKMFNDLI